MKDTMRSTRWLWLIAALTVALLATACSDAAVVEMEAPPDPTTAPTTIPVEIVEGEDLIPMSYLVKVSMATFTDKAVGPWLGECFGQSLWGAWNADDWRKNDQQFNLWGGGGYPPAFRVTYGPIAWSPDGGQWTYGQTSILKRQNEEVSDSAYLLNNSGHADPLIFSQDEEIDLSQTRSTATNEKVSLDIGTKSTASIGGDNVGAKFEQEVSATLGIETDKTQAEEESKGTSTTRHLETEVSPDAATLITIESPVISSSTPFTMSAAYVPDWVELEANPGEARPGHYTCPKQLGWTKIGERDCQVEAGACANQKVRFKWDDFLSLIGGYNVNYPNFDYQCCDKAAKTNIENVKLRWVSMSGTQHRTYQNAATVQIVDVTGQDLDAVVAKHSVQDDHIITGGN